MARMLDAAYAANFADVDYSTSKYKPETLLCRLLHCWGVQVLHCKCNKILAASVLGSCSHVGPATSLLPARHVQLLKACAIIFLSRYVSGQPRLSGASLDVHRLANSTATACSRVCKGVLRWASMRELFAWIVHCLS
eukprot:320552-Chlamydomonas_euryale.AAC.25